jgi:hypothetical protein
MELGLAEGGIVWNHRAGSTWVCARERGASMGSAMLATPPHSSPVLHVLPVLRDVAKSLQHSVAASSMPMSDSSAALSDVMSCIGQGCDIAFSVALAGRANARLSNRVSSLRMDEL